MSFYTGKYNDKSQCHITSGSHDIVDMRGPVFDNTIFHSDVSYVTYETFTIPYTGYIWEKYSRGIDGRKRNIYLKHHTYEMSQELMDKLAEGYANIIVDGVIDSSEDTVECNMYKNTTATFAKTYSTFHENDLFEYDVGGWNEVMTARKFFDSAIGNKKFDELRGEPDSTYKYLAIPCNKQRPFIDFVVFNFKYNGEVDSLRTSPDNNEIIMNNTNFIVNGIDVRTLKFLTATVINSVDKKIDFGRAASTVMQLINQKPHGIGINIKSSENTGTQIFSGTTKILDTTLGSAGMKVIRSGNYEIPARVFSTGYNSISDFPILNPGEILFLHYNMDGYDSHFGHMQGGGSFIRSYDGVASSGVPSGSSVPQVYINLMTYTQLILFREETYDNGPEVVHNLRALYFKTGANGTTYLFSQMEGGASDFQFPKFTIGYTILK